MRNYVIALCLFVYGCAGKIETPTATVTGEAPEVPSLAAAYDQLFALGAAVEAQNLETSRELLQRHFHSLTAESEMKWGNIHPIPGDSEDSYRFTAADRIVDFALALGKKVRGHTLVWHQQAPSWIFESDDPKAERPSKPEIYARIEEHITTLLSRYRGKVYAWDVVNEALADSGGVWRQSPWHLLAGDDDDGDGVPDYITVAFRAARRADPDARLFYNDYGIEAGIKLEHALALVEKLKQQGLIDGVGIQGHWSVFDPATDVVRAAIERFAALGLEVQITELDLSLFRYGDTARDTGSREDLRARQAERYASLFRMFREQARLGHLTGVTFWGVADNHTWLDFFPVPGRKDEPLLFDVDQRPKPAFFAVLEAAAAQAQESAATPAPAQKAATITINAVGDVQLGRAWPEDKASLPPDGARTLLAEVSRELCEGDLTIGNLETALADSGESRKCKPGSKVCYAFRAPTAYAAELRALGFDVLTIANNHSGDFGEEGRSETQRALGEAGIATSGVLGDIATIEHEGLRVAVIGFGFGASMYSVHDLDGARALISELAKRHDLVVVTVHAGAEGTSATRVTKTRELFLGEDRGDIHAFARAVVDAGADLVLGHGPHVLRAMELYRDRLIAYSLGNFCAWRSFSLTGPLAVSVILRATLASTGELLEAELIPTRLVGEGLAVLDPEKRGIVAVRELSRTDFGEELFDREGKLEIR